MLSNLSPSRAPSASAAGSSLGYFAGPASIAALNVMLDQDAEASPTERLAFNSTLIPVPPKLYKTSFALEPVLLRSALFKATTGPRAACREWTQVASDCSRQIFLKSDEELRQDDQRVLLTLIRQRIGMHVTNTITFVPRIFVREVLQWADCGDSVAKLKASLIRLFSAQIRVDYERPNDGDFHHFISDISFTKGAEWEVTLGNSIVQSFQRHQTAISGERRLATKDGLGSWLLGYLAATYEHTHSVSTGALRELSGHGTYSQKDFNRKLRGELEALVGAGALNSFSMHGALLEIKK